MDNTPQEKGQPMGVETEKNKEEKVKGFSMKHNILNDMDKEE